MLGFNMLRFPRSFLSFIVIFKPGASYSLVGEDVFAQFITDLNTRRGNVNRIIILCVSYTTEAIFQRGDISTTYIGCHDELVAVKRCLYHKYLSNDLR